jgi:hypothetical protein
VKYTAAAARAAGGVAANEFPGEPGLELRQEFRGPALVQCAQHQFALLRLELVHHHGDVANVLIARHRGQGGGVGVFVLQDCRDAFFQRLDSVIAHCQSFSHGNRACMQTAASARRRGDREAAC